MCVGSVPDWRRWAEAMATGGSARTWGSAGPRDTARQSGALPGAQRAHSGPHLPQHVPH